MIDDDSSSKLSIPAEIKFIRMEELLKICGMSRSTVDQAIKDGKFPAPVKLGLRATAWVEDEVQTWAKERVRARTVSASTSPGFLASTKG